MYVYFIRSLQHPNEIYIGVSEDVKRRIDEHNAGRSPHTSKFAPWELRWYCWFFDRQKAYEFERWLKTGSGRAFRSRHF